MTLFVIGMFVAPIPISLLVIDLECSEFNDGSVVFGQVDLEGTLLLVVPIVIVLVVFVVIMFFGFFFMFLVFLWCHFCTECKRGNQDHCEKNGTDVAGCSIHNVFLQAPGPQRQTPG